MRSDPPSEALAVTCTSDGVTFGVKVQPKSSRNEVCDIRNGEARIRLTSPPVDGAANEACIGFLSELLGVPRRDIRIASGEKSRHKIIGVRGITPAAATTAINEGILRRR